MNDFFINILSKYQCGFRKGIRTQHCLLLIIEKLLKIRYNKEVFASLFTDPSKTLNEYGFEMNSLIFSLSYFTNRKQNQG